MKRILSLLLAAIMVACLFSGCSYDGLMRRLSNYIERLTPEDTAWKTHVRYSLDQELIDSFYCVLEEAEQLSIAGENLDEIEQANDRLEALYMELIDQNQIAYVLYCTDLNNETFSKQYLESAEICTQAEAAYNAMAKHVYLSDTPVRDALFEDWTQEEIDMVLKHNEEIVALEQKNTELMVAYRALDKESFEADMIPLYNELVSNNNRIAQIYGYENYYSYASTVVYQRDYGAVEMQQLRQYTAKYLPGVCDSITEQFHSVYEALSQEDKDWVNALLSTKYDKLTENYVQMYIQDLPQSASQSMEGMFSQNRSVFPKTSGAYQGAFTVWIDDLPFCYYGPYYQNSETIVHELGHYYGGLYMEPWSMPVDVCETQSQGNEWLYMRFLEEHLQPHIYSSLSDYKLMTELSDILAFVILDEFEQRIYCHEHAGSMTAEEYDELLEEVAEPYGGIAYIRDNIMDLSTYWKQVLLENPVYYLSYAVSSFAAIDLYLISTENESAARDIYCKLIEEADAELGFAGNIRAAGLSGPFEETMYQTLDERYGK